jgi:uncharacterized protein YciW
MLEYSELLAVSPGNVTASDVDALREAGWRDEDIIDIVHIVGVFSYLVRMADGLGIDIEPDWAEHAGELPFENDVTAKDVGNEVNKAVQARRD